MQVSLNFLRLVAQTIATVLILVIHRSMSESTSLQASKIALKFPQLKEIDPARQRVIRDMLFINQWIWHSPAFQSRDLKETLKANEKLQRHPVSLKSLYTGPRWVAR